MFKLTPSEFSNWVSQFVIPNSERMGRRLPLFAFTELGVAMLSVVRKIERAIMVNVQIIRTFAKLRDMVVENEFLRLKLEAVEKRDDGQFATVLDAPRQLLASDDRGVPAIGFETGDSG